MFQSQPSNSAFSKQKCPQFTICPIKTNPDRAEIFAFMQSQFRVQEPITNSLNCSSGDTVDFYRDICAGCFKHNFSLIARDNGGQLAGIVLNGFWQRKVEGNGGKGEKSEREKEGRREFGQEIRNGHYESMNANRLAEFLDFVEGDLAISLPPSAERVLKLEILAVHPIFLRVGLASDLVEKSIQIARFAQCTHIATTATAVASQNLFTKFHFQTIRKIYFEDFLEDGVPVYSNLHDDGIGAQLMLLKL